MGLFKKLAVLGAILALAVPILLSIVVDGKYRHYVGAQWKVEEMPSLQGSVAIITGPTIGGIGWESALQMTKRGARVILAGRSESQGRAAVAAIEKEVPKAVVEWSMLDLGDLNSVKTFADDFIARGIPLHILINNAGVMASPFALTKQGLEQQFGINHMGHFLLTNKLLPILKSSQPSRIVSVSSAAHFIPEGLDSIPMDSLKSLPMTDVMADSEKDYGPWAAYGRSKLANVLFTHQLAKMLADEKVYANVCHPGGIMTNLQRHVQPGFDEMLGTLADPLQSLSAMAMMTPEMGAVTQLYLATSPEIEAEDIRGKYFHPQAREFAPSKYLTNESAAELWAFSEKFVKEYM